MEDTATDADGVVEAVGRGVGNRSFALDVIGYVSTPHTVASDTPIQAQRGTDSGGRVHLHDTYRSGIAGLDGFDYALLLSFLDRPTPPRVAHDRWVVEPFLLGGTGAQIGTFATRHPTRPNPIALSLVKLVAFNDDGFDFVGVDLLDNTPLIDIKPWVASFDIPPGPAGEIRCGWYDERGVLGHRGTTSAELHDPARPSGSHTTS